MHIQSNAAPDESPSASELDALEFYSQDIDTICNILNTNSLNGLLTEDVVLSRQTVYGPNTISGNEGRSMISILISNFVNFMNVILFFAFGLSITEIVHHKPDPSDGSEDFKKFALIFQPIILAAVVVTNTAVGFYQESKSEKRMTALKKLSSPSACVIRAGEPKTVPTNMLVPGDIVTINEGDQVPADIRIIESYNLRINEALLTGEALPVRKDATTMKSGPCALGDMTCIAFKSTVVSMGRAKGIVFATGFNTQIGKIAAAVSKNTAKSSKTPLEKTMFRLMLALFILSILLIVLVIGVANWSLGTTTLMYAIATAVAILPEGLHTVVIVTLSSGVSIMSKENAVVRKLHSLEALRQVTNICSDKTGTLTEGKMSLSRAWICQCDSIFTGSFSVTDGTSTFSSKLSQQVIELFYLLSALCNTCTVSIGSNKKEYQGIGDPTEIALAIVAAREKFLKSNLVPSKFKLIAEYPFNSAIKRMSVIYRDLTSGDFLILSKGAFEFLSPLCTKILKMDKNLSDSNLSETLSQISQPITNEGLGAFNAKISEFAAEGLRVLTLAIRRISADQAPSIEELMNIENRHIFENELSLFGLAGIVDPPRPETAGSILDCHRAGIVVHMITGDHPSTATAIAKQIHILPKDFNPESNPFHKGLVMSSLEFDAYSEAELDALDQLPLVVARCSPDTKVSMIHALRRRGKFIAMTGDGVNDAPAISDADVGIAMGLAGSDVTKEAADISLSDDKFSTIVKAIAQGRRIFSNIQKFTLHLLSGNVSEIVVLVGGLFLASPFQKIPQNTKILVFPMSPVQILFINLVTSSPVAVLLGMEKASKKVMSEFPKRHGVFSFELLIDTLVYGCFMGVTSLLLFALLSANGCPEWIPDLDPQRCDKIMEASGISFTTLSLMLLVHGFTCRSLRRSSVRISFRGSKGLILFSLFGTLITFLTLVIPPINRGFKHEMKDWSNIYLVFVCNIVFWLFSELYKFIKRRYYQGRRARKVRRNELEKSRFNPLSVGILPKNCNSNLAAYNSISESEAELVEDAERGCFNIVDSAATTKVHM